MITLHTGITSAEALVVMVLGTSAMIAIVLIFAFGMRGPK